MPTPKYLKKHLTFLAVLFGLIVSFVLFLGFDYLFTQTPAVPLSLKTPLLSDCLTDHPQRHQALKPNCEGISQNGSLQYTVLTNDLGFRDTSLRTVPKDPGKPRILFLGDSFTNGRTAWADTFVARFAKAFPEWDILVGAAPNYSPSHYLLLTKELLEKGYRIDEVIVDIDLSDIQDEASRYADTGPHSVTLLTEEDITIFRSTEFRDWIAAHFTLSKAIMTQVEKLTVRFGNYNLPSHQLDNIFDHPTSAWTYSEVNDTLWKTDGYAPLGMIRGIIKAKMKMTELHNLLAAKKIPLNVMVYPWPAQMVHDKVDSKGVTVWKRWCEEGNKCKRFISAYPAFFAARDACPALMPGCWYNTYFIFGDVHYNAAGNELIAGELIKAFHSEKPD
ncbi:MAG: hypothetical protein WAO98_02105 [Alphaproteobacteria bacterium]